MNTIILLIMGHNLSRFIAILIALIAGAEKRSSAARGIKVDEEAIERTLNTRQ